MSTKGRTFDVKQRTFAVAKKQDEFSVLRTGFLGPCVAFYGINEREGVAFMSHVDANLCGIRGLTDRLKEAANGDLEGFSLYVTTNYTLTLRVISLILVCASFRLVSDLRSLAFWLGALALVVGWGFASLIQIYVFAGRTFRTWRVKPRMPLQLCGRVEVSVDAASTRGPDKPREETLSTDESKRRYGPTHCWLSGQREESPKREVTALEAQCDALREVAQALDEFQREYGKQTHDSDGMPGNEYYRPKLIEIVSKARATLDMN